MQKKIDAEKMIEIEKIIWGSESLEPYVKQAIILLLTESQELTRPVCLKLNPLLKSLRTMAYRFVTSGDDDSPIIINDLLEEAGSPMFFCVRGGREITIFLGDYEEAKKHVFSLKDVIRIRLKNRFASEDEE